MVKFIIKYKNLAFFCFVLIFFLYLLINVLISEKSSSAVQSILLKELFDISESEIAEILINYYDINREREQSFIIKSKKDIDYFKRSLKGADNTSLRSKFHELVTCEIVIVLSNNQRKEYRGEIANRKSIFLFMQSNPQTSVRVKHLGFWLTEQMRRN